MMIFLLAFSLFAGTAHAQSGEMAGAPDAATSLAETSIILNFYGLARAEVLTPAIDALSPFVLPNDVLVLVSGNHRGETSPALVAQWSAMLHERFPKNSIWVLTSGLANVKTLARSREHLLPRVSTIVYDYEPNWENEPEFAFDSGKTIANFTQAVHLAHEAGLALVGAPTGRPLLQRSLAKYGWDYGQIARASAADGMLVQTQNYGRQSPKTFAIALVKLKAQQTAAGLPLDRVYPQITIDPRSPNGVPVEQALACAREARRAGFDCISLWFAPQRVEYAVRFLEGLGRPDLPLR